MYPLMLAWSADLMYRKIRLRQASKEENNAQEHDEDPFITYQIA